ncbi:MAG: radical SAM/SPASM domain-containing protein [Smithella sp.]
MDDCKSNKEIRYGFYERLKEDFPSQIIVDATEICNLACIHCPHEDFKKSEHYNARYLEPELHNKMVDEVGQYGQGKVQYIRYTSNGEPLIHPKIYDMLDYAVEKSGVFVTLTTNGTLLNDKRIEKLLSCGLHLIDISIDAFSPETYKKIRIHGNLEDTRKNVLKLIEIKERIQANTRVVTSFVEQSANSHERLQFEKFWKEEGADCVVIRRLHSSAGTVKEIAEQIGFNEDNKRRPCLYPWERILLNPRGELAFCPQDWVHGSVLADYRTTTIQEVWQGKAYQLLRDEHIKNSFKEFLFCGQCPDWRQTRWPDEGRSYADMVREIAEQS